MTRSTTKGKEQMKETLPSKQKLQFDEWKEHHKIFDKIGVSQWKVDQIAKNNEIYKRAIDDTILESHVRVAEAHDTVDKAKIDLK